MAVSVLHFINPFPTSDPNERRVHEITIESIQRSITTGTDELEVTLGIVEQQGSASGAVKDMIDLPILKRSILDLGEFTGAKPYPLIADIIESAQSFEADYYVFTNMDIALKPGFYKFISEQLIHEKHDALIINRRRIKEIYLSKELDDIYSEKGKAHPGFDCFVMQKQVIQKMILGNICVGIPFAGVALAHNIFTHAQNPKLFDKEHLTFHIGMEIFPPRDKNLYRHNRKEFFGYVKKDLWPQMDLDKFPYHEDWLPVRFYKWVRNPSLFTLFFLRLLIRKWFQSGDKNP